MKKYIITGDLGGTKCAAGIVEYDTQTHELICKKTFSIKLTETTSLENLIAQIETGLNFKFSTADAVCIGAAGQYNGENLIYEGAYPYPMQFAKLAKQQHWPAFAIVHDYTPIICATFTNYLNNPNNIKKLNSATMNPHGRRVAVGIGTGLGAKDGVLFSDGDFWLGKNEIGHIGISIPPAAPIEYLKRHQELMRFLQQDSGPLVFEKILSGAGTVRLYEFFYPNREKITPEEIGVKMRNGDAVEMCEAFAWYLGLLIGTLQLIFMPDGGIWITGGVALNHLDLFDCKSFTEGINASPAYQAERSRFPLGVLCNSEHAFIGGGYYAIKRLTV